MKYILLIVLALAIMGGMGGCANTADINTLKSIIVTQDASIEVLRRNAASASAVAKKFNEVDMRLTDIDNSGCSCDTDDMALYANRAEAAARKCDKVFNKLQRK